MGKGNRIRAQRELMRMDPRASDERNALALKKSLLEFGADDLDLFAKICGYGLQEARDLREAAIKSLDDFLGAA